MWSKTIQLLINKGIDNFIEIGPKKTLLNFIPKDFEGNKIPITNKGSRKLCSMKKNFL